MIGIINYNCGNVYAFANIYEFLQISYKIIDNEKDFLDCSKIILPGVGAFDNAIHKLKQKGLYEIINDKVLNEKIDVLGVCVGFQIMFEKSEEGYENGFGWMEGTIQKLKANGKDIFRLPHMGWNNIKIIKEHKIIEGLREDSYFYFLHSYSYLEQNHYTIAVTEYGSDFSSIVVKENIYGIQFHPEKSHSAGITILKNFARI